MIEEVNDFAFPRCQRRLRIPIVSFWFGRIVCAQDGSMKQSAGTGYPGRGEAGDPAARRGAARRGCDPCHAMTSSFAIPRASLSEYTYSDTIKRNLLRFEFFVEERKITKREIDHVSKRHRKDSCLKRRKRSFADKRSSLVTFEERALSSSKNNNTLARAKTILCAYLVHGYHSTKLRIRREELIRATLREIIFLLFCNSK